jgi:HK97 family phage prohead protease
MSDYIKKKDESAERRFINHSPQMEIREEGEERTIEGIAAVVNKETDLGWFVERIEPGAFDEVMKDDVVALFNHDPNLPLARTTGSGEGKLDIFLTDGGDLGYRFKIPNTTMGQDLAENIRNGVVSKSSFAFTIAEDTWDYSSDKEVPDRRTITKISRLFDVSPVTYPAYKDTDVAARSLERAQEPEKETHTDAVSRDRDLRELDKQNNK